MMLPTVSDPGATVTVKMRMPSLDAATKLVDYLRRQGTIQNVKVAKRPKRQNGSNGIPATSARYKHWSVSTLREILGLLREHFKETFSWSDGIALVKRQNLSSATFHAALMYGIEEGDVYKVSHGRYSFQAPDEYRPIKDSLLDVVCPDIKRLLSTFRVMTKLGDIISLYFNDECVSARFNNRERTAMLEVRIGREAFSTYHVRDHVRVTTSCGKLAGILSMKRLNKFHLVVDQKGETFRAGYLGDEHHFNADRCEISRSLFDVERPLNPLAASAEIDLPRTVLSDIFRNVYAQSDEIEITCRGDAATFESLGGAYKKKLTAGGGVRVAGSEEFSSVYDVKALFNITNWRVLKADRLALRLNELVLDVRLLDEKGFLIHYYLTPCRPEALLTSPQA